MPPFADRLIQGLIEAAAFSLMGVFLFVGIFIGIVKMSPFSIRKEIEEDQNTSLAILIGSVIIGLSIILASAVKG